MKHKKSVFITGITGWIAQHCALELIKNNYHVVGSLRSPQRENEVRTALSKEINCDDSLSFKTCDLLSDDGWDTAMTGCEYLLHVASPFVISEPKNEDDLIKPAVEGTHRALHAAQKAGVKRVVLTSSIVAMCAHLSEGSFGPDTWSKYDEKYKINAYQKSKTLAEKAAWEFIKNQKDEHKMELTVINPGAVLGPCLSTDIQGASLDICAQLLTKKMPGIPNLSVPMVDVRDVAKHHFQAMTHPDAPNKRIISASAKAIPFMQLAQTLKNNGFDVPTKKVPTWLLKALSLFDKQAKAMLPLLDRSLQCDNSETCLV